MSHLNNSEKERISVLGAGWLGLPLADHLLSRGHEVKLATRSEQRLQTLADMTEAELFQYDIENILGSNFLNNNILIINITSKKIDAFKSLLKSIQASSVKNVLFVSSTSVYKNVNREVTEESGDEDELHPLFQIEQLFQRADGFATTVLRLAGLVGYSRHPGRWFQNKSVSQPDAPVNLIHRDDCIGIIDAIIKQEAWGEVFSGSSTAHPSKREFYTAMRKSIGGEPLAFSEPSEPAYKTVSNKKVIDKLSYDFVYPDLMQCENFRVVL